MTRLRVGVQRIPISVRVAALLAGSSLLLLAIVGAFQYVQTGRSMRANIDRVLFRTVSSLRLPLVAADQPNPTGGLLEAAGGLQLLDRRGAVVTSVGEVPGRPLIGLRQIQAVRAGGQLLTTVDDPTGSGELRILAVVLDLDDPPMIELEDRATERTDLVGVVAASLAPVAAAQRAMLTWFLPAMAGASVLAGLLGWLIARRALSPIARLTQSANELKGSELSGKLPEPVTRDEVGHLARTLNDLLERLHQARRRERAFTADASHELRTPLAILRTELELARRHVRDERIAEAIDSALQECERISGLVEDLLVLARSDDAPAQRVENLVDLGEVARSVAARFKTLARLRAVSLDVRGDAVVVGDQSALDRAVSNLIDNALRYARRDGRITLEVRPYGDGAQIVVADDGPGVPEEHLPHLFERFYRPDSARSRGGAGLGLAIVASVAERHGGRASARNRPGGGLEVILEVAGR